MDFSLESIGIENKKQLKKFYKLWSSTLTAKVKKYAQENSLSWFNTKWRAKSKEIPFYIQPVTKSAIGGVWIASKPVNYAFGKGIGKLNDKYKRFPKRMKVKAVRVSGRWFTPKRFKPDVKGIDPNLAETRGLHRFFVSRTSHNKTHKYKRPMLWGQERSTRAVFPVFLKEQMADYVVNDPAINTLILEAFNEVVESRKYL